MIQSAIAEMLEDDIGRKQLNEGLMVPNKIFTEVEVNV